MHTTLPGACASVLSPKIAAVVLVSAGETGWRAADASQSEETALTNSSTRDCTLVTVMPKVRIQIVAASLLSDGFL